MIPDAARCPRITIVTPAFRSADTIAQTILSVQAQDYPDLEYLVLDGAGDDGATAAILHRLDGAIDWWRSAPDAGQYAAIAEGFARATGDVLFWLNADDVLLPGALRMVGEIFAQCPQVDWLTSLMPGHLDRHGTLRKFSRLPGLSRDALLDGYYLPGIQPVGRSIQQESTFFRRALWDKAGDALCSQPLAGDFALWCAFIDHAQPVGVPHPIGAFRHRPGQRSADRATYLREGRAALEAARARHGLGALPRWSRFLYRGINMIPGLHRVPGYPTTQTGLRATRVDTAADTPHWQVLPHRWIPR